MTPYDWAQSSRRSGQAVTPDYRHGRIQLGTPNSCQPFEERRPPKANHTEVLGMSVHLSAADTSPEPEPIWRRPEREVAVSGQLLVDLADGHQISRHVLARLNAGAKYRRPQLRDPTAPLLIDPNDAAGTEALDAETVPLADPLDVLIAREEAMERVALRWRTRGLMRTLEPIERDVLKMRYGFGNREPMGPAAIAAQLGICRKTAYNIEQRALAKLRGDAGARELLAAVEALVA